MRTITRVHQFSRATFAPQGTPNSAGHEPKAPEPTVANLTTAFQCNAYSMGQWCLPYSVPVRRLRWSHRSAS